MNSNDVVIKQYESLPYPEFSESNILSEEEYYKTDVQNPKIFIPSHSLEKINHYFYAGDQNFRWVYVLNGTNQEDNNIEQTFEIDQFSHFFHIVVAIFDLLRLVEAQEMLQCSWANN